MKIGKSIISTYRGCYIFNMQNWIDKMQDCRFEQLDIKIICKLNELSRNMMDHNRYVHNSLMGFYENR